MKLQELIQAVKSYQPNADTDLIQRAYAFARNHHQGQTRSSGEPYITHVTEVAFLGTKLKLDVDSIVTALLHDTVEDTDATLDDIRIEFGADIASLVDGVTKLSQVQFSSRLEAQAENFRKMLLAMASDIRVLLIKLCDRLHNMQTLEYLSDARRVRIAQETLDIYAMLAQRLGIYWIKSELEDLSLRYLKPTIYQDLKTLVAKSKKEREKHTKEMVHAIEQVIAQNGVVGEVSGRPKHFYSIYQKMEKSNLSFEEIHDLIAFRIVVGTTMECYAALGAVHAAWKPIPGRFKDYIAMPKPNNYQSLHTTVIGSDGNRIEIQIRTHDMHDIAEKGIAAHWRYKEVGSDSKTLSKNRLEFSWLRDLLESGEHLRDPYEFLNTVKEDLFSSEVYVFTPRGDLLALSAGATPIDFAYAIHSDVGHRCNGARVNGQQVPISYQLRNGDTVAITTSEHQHPSKDWLNIATTSKAKQRIRNWLKQEERNRSITVGRELLNKDFRKVKLNLNKAMKDGSIKEVAESFGLTDADLLLAEIGYGKISSQQVVKKLLPEDQSIEQKLAKDETPLQKIFQKAARAFRDQAGIKVGGMDNVVFRFARCCEPLPGDELLGYITRGRGVAIHTRRCTQAHGFDPARLVDVSWDDTCKTFRQVNIRVQSIDKIGLLTNLTQAIAEKGASIVNAHIQAHPDGKAVSSFEIKVESTSQLNAICRSLEKVNGVLKVERAKSTKGISNPADNHFE